MNILVIGLTIIVLVGTIIKILNVIYIAKLSKENRRRKADLEKVNLINSTVSYEQFKRVAKESSVLNSPIRVSGDFMDFILESISFSDVGIENRILTLNYGEEHDR